MAGEGKPESGGERVGGAGLKVLRALISRMVCTR